MASPGYFALLKEAYNDWSADNSSQMAAALAYYTIFSMAPLLILAVVIAGMFFNDQQAKEQLGNQMNQLVGKQGADFVLGMLEHAQRPGSMSIASLISIGVLLFGASGVFAQLQDSLNRIWEVKTKPNLGIMGFIRTRLLSFSMVLGIGFLLLVSLILSAVLNGFSETLSQTMPGGSIVSKLTDIVLSFVIITLLFAMIYKILPDVKITWKDVWTGAILTALLFTVGKFLIGWYLGRSSYTSTYGAAGSLVILLAWVYYSSLILFFGAEFTQVYTRSKGSVIEPDEHAIRIREE